MMVPDSSQKHRFEIGIALVLYKGQVLVGSRASDVHLGGFDEFPGGKCEPEESAAGCAIRECKEETGLHVEIRELFYRQQFEYDTRVVDLSFFLCEPSSTDELKAISAPFHWVPIADLAELNFPDGNTAVVQKLMERFSDHTLG